MRIAIFHQSADLYGSDRVLLELVANLASSGIDPIVFLPSQGPLCQSLLAAGIEFHVLPVVRLDRSRLSLRGIVSIAREALRVAPAVTKALAGRDVAAVHSNTLAVLGGAIWALRKGLPHVWHVHEIIERPRFAARCLAAFVHVASDRVICNSRATRDWLVGIRPCLALRTTVVVNGVTPPSIIRIEESNLLRRRFLPHDCRVVVGLVGRINRWKGHFLLLEAAEQLHLRGVTAFTIVFVGSAAPGQEHLKDALVARIQRSPIRESIVLEDFHDDIWPIWNAIDIACVPSTEPEPFGLVAIEAMMSGKPVVASAHGGLVDIVEDGQTGLLVAPRSVEALADAIAALLADGARRISMGQNARLRASRLYGVSTMCERIVAVYRDAVSNCGRSGEINAPASAARRLRRSGIRSSGAPEKD